MPTKTAEDQAKPDTEPIAPETSDAATDRDEVEEPRPAAPSVVRRLPSGRTLLIVAAVLLLLASLTTAVLQWREAERLRDTAHTEQLIRTRSAEFSQALLAYQYTDLDGARRRIRSLSSAEFGQSYETAFDGLADVIRKYEATATATVRDIYVNEIDGQRARSFVILDTEVHSTAGTRRVLGTKLMLDLIQEKGSWKINSLTTLAADDETLTKPETP